MSTKSLYDLVISLRSRTFKNQMKPPYVQEKQMITVNWIYFRLPRLTSAVVRQSTIWIPKRNITCSSIR